MMLNFDARFILFATGAGLPMTLKMYNTIALSQAEFACPRRFKRPQRFKTGKDCRQSGPGQPMRVGGHFRTREQIRLGETRRRLGFSLGGSKLIVGGHHCCLLFPRHLALLCWSIGVTGNPCLIASSGRGFGSIRMSQKTRKSSKKVRNAVSSPTSDSRCH